MTLPFYVCVPCSHAKNPGGFNTAQAAIDAAAAHGCATRFRLRRTDAVKIPAPRLLPAMEWKKALDSLTPHGEGAGRCRARCSHWENAHLFSSHTQKDCSINCRFCMAIGRWGA